MNTHELARLLLTLPDLPVATHANNHTYASKSDSGSVLVGLLHHYCGDHIIIGNPSKKDLNHPNYYITDFFR
jgi:hypothetical protein